MRKWCSHKIYHYLNGNSEKKSKTVIFVLTLSLSMWSELCSTLIIKLVSNIRGMAQCNKRDIHILYRDRALSFGIVSKHTTTSSINFSGAISIIACSVSLDFHRTAPSDDIFMKEISSLYDSSNNRHNWHGVQTSDKWNNSVFTYPWLHGFMHYEDFKDQCSTSAVSSHKKITVDDQNQGPNECRVLSGPEHC